VINSELTGLGQIQVALGDYLQEGQRALYLSTPAGGVQESTAAGATTPHYGAPGEMATDTTIGPFEEPLLGEETTASTRVTTYGPNGTVGTERAIVDDIFGVSQQTTENVMIEDLLGIVGQGSEATTISTDAMKSSSKTKEETDDDIIILQSTKSPPLDCERERCV
jgi:hypothetical protein